MKSIKKTLKKMINRKKRVAPAPLPAPTAEQIAKSKEEALDRTCAEAERLFKLDQDKGGRRNRKTRRGGRTMPVDAALMKEMKAKHENDLKKTGIDMRKKIVAIANELKARRHSLGEDLLTTLNAPVEYGDGVENAKSMLMGFFRNVPEVPDTTRKSTNIKFGRFG